MFFLKEVAIEALRPTDPQNSSLMLNSPNTDHLIIRGRFFLCVFSAFRLLLSASAMDGGPVVESNLAITITLTWGGLICCPFSSQRLFSPQFLIDRQVTSLSQHQSLAIQQIFLAYTWDWLGTLRT